MQKNFTTGRKFIALEVFGFDPPLKSSAGKIKSGLTDYKKFWLQFELSIVYSGHKGHRSIPLHFEPKMLQILDYGPMRQFEALVNLSS